MDRKKVLQDKIVVLTNKLRDGKPTVYKHLMETPQTLPDNENDEEFIKALEKYEKHLEELLEDDSL